MKRLLFITTGLETGGAEGKVVSLIEGLDHDKVEPLLINLGAEGHLKKRVLKSGCLYQQIDLKKGFLGFNLFTFFETVLSFQPHVVQGWMYHGSVFALLAKLIWPFGRVHLGIRNLKVDGGTLSKSSLLAIKLIKAMMFLSKSVVFPSNQAKELHENLGFSKNKSKVIKNGCDTSRFLPVSIETKDYLKEKWVISKEKKLIGFVSRFHPHKDPHTFIKVVKILVSRHSNLQFLCVGQGLGKDNKELVALIESEGLQHDIVLKGVVKEIEEIYQVIDGLVLTSVGEAFPNVLIEAMACGVPCVSTRVGNVEELLGSLGGLAEPGDPEEIATVVEMVCLNQKNQSHERREWVCSHFSITSMSVMFGELWQIN